MAGDRVERRLAAILAADVVGYSRLVRQDEEHTVAAVASLISGLIEPAVEAHRGRVFKKMGDAAPARRPTDASSSASGFMSATWSSTATTSRVTV